MIQNSQKIFNENSNIMVAGREYEIGPFTIDEIINEARISSFQYYQYIKGTNNDPEIENKIQFAIERLKSKSTVEYGKSPHFVETNLAKRFFEAADLCRNFKEIAIATAEAGSGKTLVAREYVKSRENVILIEVDVSYNHQILLRELKKKCGEYGTGSLSIMLKNIVEALADRDYLLIVDEAENLTKKSLEFLRFIYDRSGTSILLCGTPKLISNIRGINLENQQLSSRIGMQVKLPSLNEDDIKLIAEKLIPGKTKCFNTLLIESKGNARRLSKIILRAEYISILNNTNITHDVIKKAADLLL